MRAWINSSIRSIDLHERFSNVWPVKQLEQALRRSAKIRTPKNGSALEIITEDPNDVLVDQV